MWVRDPRHDGGQFYASRWSCWISVCPCRCVKCPRPGPSEFCHPGRADGPTSPSVINNRPVNWEGILWTDFVNQGVGQMRVQSQEGVGSAHRSPEAAEGWGVTGERRGHTVGGELGLFTGHPKPEVCCNVIRWALCEEFITTEFPQHD